MEDDLKKILGRLQHGEIDLHKAAGEIRRRAVEPLGFASVDHLRAERCGNAEVVFAAGKTSAQVVSIVRAIRKHHSVALITRARPEHVAALRRAFLRQRVIVGERGGTVIVGKPVTTDEKAGGVAIVTAGTSDEPVAEEAALTCLALGEHHFRVNDVGVAGLHRLGDRLNELRSADVVVCIAGMEGALPSVVGGLVRTPVIAVPTSVGYGAAFGGVAALLGMLTSCASGVTVVNIDNGFGAAFTACRISRMLRDRARR